MLLMNWLNAVYDGDRGRTSTEFGSRYKRERVLKDINGIPHLDDCGKSDLYEYIQSHKDSVDINVILERYQNGDITALDRTKGQYLDVANAPKSLAEMYSFIKNCTTFFDGLPLKVRQEYDFNPAAFVADIGSKRFMDLMSDKDVSVAPAAAAATSESEGEVNA